MDIEEMAVQRVKREILKYDCLKDYINSNDKDILNEIDCILFSVMGTGEYGIANAFESRYNFFNELSKDNRKHSEEVKLFISKQRNRFRNLYQSERLKTSKRIIEEKERYNIDNKNEKDDGLKKEDIQKIIKSYAISYIQEELGKGLKSLERSSNKYVKIKYNPGKKVTYINNPIGQSEEWNLDIKCQKCEPRYSVIGSAYFCPHCGFNSVEKVLDESLDTISKMLNSVSEMKLMFSDMYGKDKAETMSRSMIEGSIGDVVSAFQKFAEMRFKTLSDKNVRVNDFQMVEKGSNLYREVISYGYEKWLNEEELDKMNLYFQRRHILEHNNGIIDQKYIEKSNDTTYKIGQRVIIKIEDVYELLDIIKKLTNGLKKI